MGGEVLITITLLSISHVQSISSETKTYMTIAIQARLQSNHVQVGSDKQPSPKGRLVPYPSHNGIDRKTGKPLPLPEMRSENILLTLPPEMNQVNNNLF